MDSIAEIFSDLTPIEQDDGPVPVVRIAYSQAFTIVMGYFRRVLVNEEYSERALHLSAEVIDHNAANYTAWQYRRRCVAEMHKNDPEEERLAAWREELKYCSEQCMHNVKNYQVWFHRRACIAALGDATGELDFIAAVLDDDAKNYHAWGHRQWVLKTFDLWAAELAYVDELLSADVRNNSAWNQRYFVLQASADLNSPDLVASEIACALAPAITHAALRARAPEIALEIAPPRAAVLSAGLVSPIVCVCRYAQANRARAVQPVAVGVREGPRRAAWLLQIPTASSNVRAAQRPPASAEQRARRRGRRRTGRGLRSCREPCARRPTTLRAGNLAPRRHTGREC